MTYQWTVSLISLGLGVTSAVAYCFVRGKAVLLVIVLAIPAVVLTARMVSHELQYMIFVGIVIVMQYAVAIGWGFLVGNLLVSGNLWWALTCLFLVPVLYIFKITSAP